MAWNHYLGHFPWTFFCQAKSNSLTSDNCAETTNYIAWHRLLHTQKFVMPTSIIHIWVWHSILDYKQMVWWYYYLVYIYNEKNDKSIIIHYEITDFSYYHYRYIIDDKQYMMTSSNGNIFHVTGPLWGETTGGFPSQRPVTWNFDVFFDLCLNKRLSKQSGCWWLEMQWRSLWCHCNELRSLKSLIISHRMYKGLLKSWYCPCSNQAASKHVCEKNHINP